MGNLDLDNFCNCENNDSKIETSFKTNQTGDKMLCPFVKTIIYQNFNIETAQKIKNTPKLKNKELNFSKNKPKFDPNECEMNFEYHTTKPNKLKDSNKPKIPNKSIFNLNPDTNNDKASFNDNNNINYDNNINDNNEQDDENKNKIITLENDNYIENNNNINVESNQKGIEEENINQNKNYKINEISSNNSANSNIKTNIDKPKQIPKNGLDFQIWSKNVYYIGYYNEGVAEGIGKLITGNSKYYGEFKDDQANGYGIYYNNSNEIIYEGMWTNDNQNEYGIEKWSDDSIFFGKYSNGEKNGVGTYLWKDGSIYEGEFCNNMFEGYGIYYYNKNKIYLGEWKNNKKNGYGELIFGDKIYVGYFLNDQKDGFGISFLNNSDKIYIGFWKNSKKKGFGKIFNGNKMKYGIWGDENDNKKTEWFNTEEEAYNYLDNNNLDDFKKYFEYDKEEITSYMDKYYENDFIAPCTISEFLKK